MHPKTFVAVLMGSDSDLEILRETFNELKLLGIHYEARILSAHRTPQAVSQYVQDADNRGCAVFIAAAGMAAHLAGAVAANTIKPVIGIPLDAGNLGGIDALLATVQMPGGTPVACTSIGKAGAKNAAHIAAQILALTQPTIAEKLNQLREKKRHALSAADKKLQTEIMA